MGHPEEMEPPNNNGKGPHIPISFKRNGSIVTVSSFMDKSMDDPDVVVLCDCGNISFVKEGGNKDVVSLRCPKCQNNGGASI